MGQLVPNSIPTGKKAKRRQWVDLTNEAQHSGTRGVSLERTESTVNCSGLVCYSSLKSCIARDIL